MKAAQELFQQRPIPTIISKGISPMSRMSALSPPHRRHFPVHPR
ncbi:hypothetical protein AvCA_38120 [Azotobacter vinelandii CA]|uniref:Uncharacterized protein n=2 Tax=Azotobacter vinelandii TaxID=354 RepID=C1DS79_AZOVD|nr:hypothetical protein Avin_38120 [Azotobacter vinelandii DJ]AGK14520.1 hypothetical protein AvCA_38120 [Azotobacter vinelandii CA]AGK21623.1 hypothetical protein AvCA6_38120 [Azotobacter vinelandii CA6]